MRSNLSKINQKSDIWNKNWFWSAITFGIPFLVSVLICAGCGIYPFGENCILHVDMYHQYCPFFMELHEKLTTGGSLFFSWNLGLGSDFLSTFAYYLASPLNWFVVFVPKEFVIEYMTFITWIKIALGGMFFFWFLRERFSIVDKDGSYHVHSALSALVFSTAYAFSGFVAAYSWNIMWMDAVALAPLIIMGLEQLVKKKKVMIYYISLSVAILSNFYISLIICIFLVLYFGVLLLENITKEEMNSYKNNPNCYEERISKNENYCEEIKNSYENNTNSCEEIRSNSKNNENYSEEVKNSYENNTDSCEEISNSTISKPSKSKFREIFSICFRFAWYSLLAGGTGAILLIPEAIMLSYSASGDGGFPESMEWYYGLKEGFLRLSFITEPYTTGGEHWPNIYCGIFTVFLVLLYFLNKQIGWKQKVLRGSLLLLLFVSFANNYLDFIWHGLRFPNSLPGRQSFLFIFMMLTMGYECWLKRKGNHVIHYVVAVLPCFGFLGYHFATAEGAEWIEITSELSLLLSMIFLAGYFLLLLCLRFGKQKIRFALYGALFGLAIAEIIVSMAVTGFYSLSRNAYLQKMQDYEILLALAELDAKEEIPLGQEVFYRVEDTERKTKNDDCLYGYPSTTIFSSLMNIEVSHFYQSMYMEGGKNYYCYNGATPLPSAMLSVRYMLSDNADGENALRHIVAQSGGYYLYENNYCLPLGFVMQEEVITSWENSKTDRLESINSLSRALEAEDEMLTFVEVNKEVESGRTVLTVLEDGFYYANAISCNADSLTVSVDGEASTRFGKTTHRYLFEFGECKAGEEIVITNSKNSAVDFDVYKLDLDALEQAFTVLNEQTMTLTSHTDTSLSGMITVKEAGRLVLSIPYEEGWTLFVNGKETKAEALKETFLSVCLEEGTHEISLSYRTPGFDIGVRISAVCVGLFIFSVMIRRRKASVSKL